MADYYIEKAISGCQSEEELDAVMEIFNTGGCDVNLTRIAMATRARLVSESLMSDSRSCGLEQDEMDDMVEAMITEDLLFEMSKDNPEKTKILNIVQCSSNESLRKHPGNTKRTHV